MAKGRRSPPPFVKAEVQGSRRRWPLLRCALRMSGGDFPFDIAAVGLVVGRNDKEFYLQPWPT